MEIKKNHFLFAAVIMGLVTLYVPQSEAFSLREFFGIKPAAVTTITKTTATYKTTVSSTTPKTPQTQPYEGVDTKIQATRRSLGIVDGHEVIEEIGLGTGQLLFMPTDAGGQTFAYTFDPISTVFTVSGDTVTGFNKADNTFLKIAPADSGFSRSTVNAVTGDITESISVPAFKSANFQMD